MKKLNPEWTALENKEYILLSNDPLLDPYKEIKIGPPPNMQLDTELMNLLNKYNQEAGSDTPDFILSTFLLEVLEAWNRAVSKREIWYNREAPILREQANSSPCSSDAELKT